MDFLGSFCCEESRSTLGFLCAHHQQWYSHGKVSAHGNCQYYGVGVKHPERGGKQLPDPWQLKALHISRSDLQQGGCNGMGCNGMRCSRPAMCLWCPHRMPSTVPGTQAACQPAAAKLSCRRGKAELNLYIQHNITEREPAPQGDLAGAAASPFSLQPGAIPSCTHTHIRTGALELCRCPQTYWTEVF